MADAASPRGRPISTGPRPSRATAAIDRLTDIHGDRWLISEYRFTSHGLPLAMGWPEGAGRGGIRVAITAALAEYLQSIERPRDIDLPISRTTIKRLRTDLGLHFDWDRWWAARADDLRGMALEQFCAQHHCSMGAASQRRAKLTRCAAP